RIGSRRSASRYSIRNGGAIGGSSRLPRGGWTALRCARRSSKVDFRGGRTIESPVRPVVTTVRGHSRGVRNADQWLRHDASEGVTTPRRLAAGRVWPSSVPYFVYVATDRGRLRSSCARG